MASKKEISLIGYVGKDPELKQVGEHQLTSFSVGVSEMYGDKKTMWFTCDVWGRKAEPANNYIKKGSLIGIDGELQRNEYKDKTYLKVRVKEFHLLEKKGATNSVPKFDKPSLISKPDNSDDVPF